jgi:hypothetical protein
MDAHNRKLADYLALIRDSRNYEDVVEAWPEGGALSAIVGARAPNAVMRLNPDVIARIAADVASRAACAS